MSKRKNKKEKKTLIERGIVRSIVNSEFYSFISLSAYICIYFFSLTKDKSGSMNPTCSAEQDFILFIKRQRTTVIAFSTYVWIELDKK